MYAYVCIFVYMQHSTQFCKSFGLQQNSGSMCIDFGQFLIRRHFVRIVSSIFRLFVSCPLSFFVLGYDSVMENQ